MYSIELCSSVTYYRMEIPVFGASIVAEEFIFRSSTWMNIFTNDGRDRVDVTGVSELHFAMQRRHNGLSLSLRVFSFFFFLFCFLVSLLISELVLPVLPDSPKYIV